MQTTDSHGFPAACPRPSNFSGMREVDLQGSVVTYQCLEGFKLVGSAKQVCHNGTWEPPDAPTCVATDITKPYYDVTCPKPFLINGYLMYSYGSEFKPGDPITVKCNEQYAMEVDDSVVKILRLVCSQDGKWVTEGGWQVNPECSVRLCGMPPEVPNSHVSYNQLSIPVGKIDVMDGQAVNYVCEDGYTLVDSAANKLICRNGEWDGSLPTCVSDNVCAAPDQVRYGSYTFSGRLQTRDLGQYKLGSLVTYSCDVGFKLVGPATLECLEGSIWSHHPPQCIAQGESTRYCSTVKTIPNGDCFCESKNDLQFCEPFFQGMHVECVCKQGYKLIGQSIVTCGTDGHWDYLMPTCVQAIEIDDSQSSSSSGGHTHMSTLAIVVATACSVLGVLLLVMVIMVFRRRKPHPPRLCRPSSVPPPYSRVHSNSLDEQDRMLLIGYDNAPVNLPSYEEAVRGHHPHTSHFPQTSGQGQVGEYRPLPSIPTNFRGGHGETSSRHSITTTSTMNRDGISEVFGSIDTVNVSMSDASTAVTVETCESSSSHHSNMSRRATAGSINSSNVSLVTEDVPLLDSNQRSEEIEHSASEDNVHDKTDD